VPCVTDETSLIDLDATNLQLVNSINDDGRIYLTQTLHDEQLVIRFQTGQFDMQASDIDIAYQTITELARSLSPVKTSSLS
jgi:aromatic-L-amino-acid decarboxylase